MVATVQDVHVQTFFGNLLHLSQQTNHRTNGFYRYKDLRAESGLFDRLDKVAMAAYTDRHGDSPVNDAPFSRRRVTPANYEWGDIVDRADIVRMLMDPSSDLVQAGAASVNRQKDQLWIDAALGNATAVTASGGDASVALPGGQTIAHGSAGLTFAKILAAKELLDDVDAPLEGRIALIGSQQLNRDLLNIQQATSGDYNPAQALLEGQMPRWMGFTWVMSNQLSIASTTRSCIFAQRNGMGLALNEDHYHYVESLPTKRNAYQVYVEMIGGATRIEDELVVEVECTEV